jgi:D-alanyl-D-alanine carboxypeptidase
MGIASDELVICEGSGISRNNKITGNVMMKIMEDFREYADLLSVKNGVLVKSGTLNGVHNYTGYIKTKTGLRPFVIMLNQNNNCRDKIMGLLVDYCK